MPASSASRRQGTPPATASDPEAPFGEDLRHHLERLLIDLPVLDLKPLQDLLDLGASPDLVQELVVLFEEDVPVRMALLKKALDSGNLQQTLMESHQLKGALSNLGLKRFADLAARIEQSAREGHLEQAPSLAEGLDDAYVDALLALKQAHPPA